MYYIIYLYNKNTYTHLYMYVYIYIYIHTHEFINNEYFKLVLSCYQALLNDVLLLLYVKLSGES